MSNLVISNSDTGIAVGSQSDASYDFDTVTISNVDVGISMDGSGELTMNAVDLSTTTNDLSISSGTVMFLDGTVDQLKVDVDSTSTGTFNRDRVTSQHYLLMEHRWQTQCCDVKPKCCYNISRYYRLHGVASGLKFSIYDLDANGVTDYTTYLTHTRFPRLQR